jgi:hypothetical protein
MTNHQDDFDNIGKLSLGIFATAVFGPIVPAAAGIYYGSKALHAMLSGLGKACGAAARSTRDMLVARQYRKARELELAKQQEPPADHQQDDFREVEKRFLDNCKVILASSMTPEQKQNALKAEQDVLETRINRIMK